MDDWKGQLIAAINERKTLAQEIHKNLNELLGELKQKGISVSLEPNGEEPPTWTVRIAGRTAKFAFEDADKYRKVTNSKVSSTGWVEQEEEVIPLRDAIVRWILEKFM